jgi:peptidoglycan/xylan/chitin deacetylase (PgdA/CDA1 family)
MNDGTPTTGDRTNRRRFLATLGAGSMALAAGCTDQFAGDEDEEEGDDNETAPIGEDEDGEEEMEATPPAIDHGELVSDFDEDFDEWFALEGEITADEENFLTGSQTVRIDGDGGSAGIARSFPDGLDVEGHHLSLAVRVDNPRPARVTVRILAPGQADQIWSTRTILSQYEGWLRMDVGYTGQRGEPFFDDIQELQITLDDPDAAPAAEEEEFDEEDAEDEENETEVEEDEENETEVEEDEEELSLQIEPILQVENETDEEADEGEGIRFWVDDLKMTPQASQGYVMLTFDDGVESQYENAFPMLQERDMQAVAAVVPDSLNRPERLNIDHLREMRDAGWDVSSHPEGEAFMELDDPEAIRQDIESAHEYLDNRGFADGARHMFVPYHNTNEEVVEITREYHELSSYFGGTPNNVPFTDPMHLSRVNMFDIDAFTAMIDRAAEHNQLAIGLAHGVVPEDEIDDDPLADMTTDQLAELLDYIEESDVQAVTASDLIDNQDEL